MAKARRPYVLSGLPCTGIRSAERSCLVFGEWTTVVGEVPRCTTIQTLVDRDNQLDRVTVKSLNASRPHLGQKSEVNVVD